MDANCVCFGLVSIDGKYVLIQDADKPSPHFWKMPGGHKKIGEAPEEGMRREMREELPNIEVAEVFPKPVYEKQLSDHSFLMFFIKGRVGNREPGDEVRKWGLFSWPEIQEKIKKQLLLFNHANALTAFFRELG